MRVLMHHCTNVVLGIPGAGLDELMTLLQEPSPPRFKAYVPCEDEETHERLPAAWATRR